MKGKLGREFKLQCLRKISEEICGVTFTRTVQYFEKFKPERICISSWRMLASMARKTLCAIVGV